MADIIEFEDSNESYCAGDLPLDEVDWDQVVKLDGLQKAALAVSEDDRPMAMLGLLHEMYGDDLVVL